MSGATHDLVIAGGGLAGSSLACAAGATGRRVAIIESFAVDDERQPSFDERTIALTLASRHVFEAIGAWDAAASKACAIESIHVSDRGRFGAARLDRRHVGAEALGYVVPTRALGRALTTRIQALDNVEFACPATAERLEQNTESVTVHTADGRRFEAPLLVIADGGRSPLGAQAGLALKTRDYPQMALVAVVEVSRDHDRRAYERFTRHGPLALLPMTDRRMALAWTLPAEEARALADGDEDAFLNALQAAFGWRQGRFTRAGARRAYPLSLGLLDHPASGRVVAIGNAAHVVHPVAGQGFNLGLRDVADLTEHLAACWRDGGDIGASAALRAYGERRRRQVRRVGRFTDGLIGLFTATAPGVPSLRALGLNLIDLCPPAKRMLLQRTMGRHGRLPGLVRGVAPPEGP